MKDLHGIIIADHSAPELRELVATRTSASVPFCGRYRLIDFALSSMTNAGVRDVGVIMQRDYQSLLDHLGSGKEWDMSRKRGGLRLLPPFGQLAENQRGEYAGVVEALLAVRSYIEEIPQDYVVLTRGNLAGNIDLDAMMARHVSSGAVVTVACSEMTPDHIHHRYVPDGDGLVKQFLYRRHGPGPGLASLETYIMTKSTLLDIMERCENVASSKFHRDGLGEILASGGRIAVYLHPGYATHITNIIGYYRTSMDMLIAENRASLFPADRPVRTKGRSDVSTHYGETAAVRNCLVADGCLIEGELTNCVIFRGVRVERGAALKNCIIMQDTRIGEHALLSCVISDKNAEVSPFVTLTGSPRLPLVLPKGSRL